LRLAPWPPLAVRLALGKGRLLFGARFRLVLGLPFLIGHAVDHLPRPILAELKTLLTRRLLVPISEAVAAKARHVHEIDVLHLMALAQMSDEAAECRCFQLGLEASVDLGHHRFSIAGRPRRRRMDCPASSPASPGY
jgi:hypothetical protein